MRHLAAELVDDAGARIGEGPTWDADYQELVWIDIESSLVRRSDAEGTPLETIDAGIHVGAALPALGGGWLLAAADGFRFLTREGACDLLLAIDADRPELRFNDAKCDPQGRAIAGTMRYDAAPGEGTLYRLDPGPRVEVLLRGQGLCNGIGWSPDATRMYFIDTLSRRVATYDYDLTSGSMAGGGSLVEIDPALGMPDGLCVDDEGGVWVAIHSGGAVHRYRPDGTLDTVVDLSVPLVTSVAFGGPGRNRLFVTTSGGPGMNHVAGDGSTPGEAQPAGAGGLWAVDPGVSGPPATPWRPVAGAGAARNETSEDPQRQETDHDGA